MRSRITSALLVLALFSGCKQKVNDRQASLNTTTRLSLATGNIQGNNAAVVERCGVSDDGRFIAFCSKASNLVAADTNNVADVFLRDNLMKTTELVSVNSAGTAVGNGPSGSPSISSDGRYVCFLSKASNITIDDPDTIADVFVRDMIAGVTTLVSRAPGSTGAKADADCANPEISRDGQAVVFDSTANNLDGAQPGGPDNDGFSDVYVRQWLNAAGSFPTLLASVASTVLGGAKGTNNSTAPSVSGNGRYIAFQTQATNLTPDISVFGDDTNAPSIDIVVRDVLTNSTVRASVANPSSVIYPNPDGSSFFPSISSDGRYVAFLSNAGNLVPEDDGPSNDIFVRDMVANVNMIASVHTSGAQAGNSCNNPRISGDGNFVTWQSGSASLINGDANGVTDIFLHDIVGNTTARISVATFGGELNAQSLRPNISFDGKYVAFYSEAANAADDDTNGTADFYLRGPPF